MHFAVFATAVLALWLAAVLYERKGSPSHQRNEFCYVNSFEQSENFRPVTSVPFTRTRLLVEEYADVGKPFVVSGVTRGWGANSKWNHSYFKEIFQEFTLFSSTFTTEKSPHFSVPVAQDVYYGIFLNDRKLADLVAGDYRYPEFIPSEWRVTGNEWLHWGHPPCGARRHMDLMCTSRISVQVAGKKMWRLYPLIGTGEEEEEEGEGVKGIGNWTEVLRPLEVTLQPGDALVWFPGWEHETRILTGPSISLSLHFTSPGNSSYQNTFSELLSQKVSPHCKWRNR